MEWEPRAAVTLLRAPHGCSQACKDIDAESPWRKTSIKQILAGCRASGWKGSCALHGEVRSRARLPEQSHTVEESIGDMKNRTIPRQSPLFRTAETNYFLSIKEGCLATRTEFETAPLDTALEIPAFQAAQFSL